MGNVELFVDAAVEGVVGDVERRRAVFAAVQVLPYATDTTHDAEAILKAGSGNCVAKASLLRRSFELLGYEARLVRWRYRITDPFRSLLPVAEDMHTATQVKISGEWRTVDATHDATHDPALPTSHFVVAQWDGLGDTELAYEPTSPIWIEGIDDAAIEAAIQSIMDGLSGHDTREYARQFNDWVQECRRRYQST